MRLFHFFIFVLSYLDLERFVVVVVVIISFSISYCITLLKYLTETEKYFKIRKTYFQSNRRLNHHQSVSLVVTVCVWKVLAAWQCSKLVTFNKSFASKGFITTCDSERLFLSSALAFLMLECILQITRGRKKNGHSVHSLVVLVFKRYLDSDVYGCFIPLAGNCYVVDFPQKKPDQRAHTRIPKRRRVF